MSWATDHAVSSDTLIYNGHTWYPVTNWVIGQGITTGGGLDDWLSAAVRFLMSDDSTSGSNHIIAQYAACANKGLVDTNNGYYLMRRLGSPITTYTGTSSSANSFWSTLDSSQRQGLVKNAPLTGLFLWYNTPYFVTDLGIVNDGVKLTSTEFYVGTTQVISGVYQQTSIISTYTTPINVATSNYNKFVIGETTYLDLSRDTVTPETLLAGYTAHNANGELIVGTYEGGDMSIEENRGGVDYESYDLLSGTAVWPTTTIKSGHNGWGWREEKYSDGRLKKFVWAWYPFYGNAGTWQFIWKDIPIDGGTDFTDTPIVRISSTNNNIDANCMGTITAVRASAKEVAAKTLCYCNSRITSGNGRAMMLLTLDGHWM